MRPDLVVKLLGEVRLLRGGAPVVLPPSKKTRALLAFLVATRAAQPRQRLCDLLWDGPDDPRAALRWSLTKLRPLVDDARTPRLVADRERVAFAEVGVEVDLFAAEAELASAGPTPSIGALERAAKGLAGELLEGLDLPDCYRFHAWCTGERERVRKLRLHVLDALVERLAADPERALPYARERVGVDPLSDVAQASVVRVLAHLGRRAEAHAQVETCRRILDREHQGRRSPALDLARLEIGKVAARPAVVIDAPAPPPPVQRDGGPLVARTTERAALAALAESAATGRAHEVLLFAGEPGIGKTRLLEELAARIHAHGGTVLSARAFEAEAVRAYGVWSDLLRGLAASAIPPHLADALAPLLPESGASARDSEGEARLFDGVTSLVRALAARGPVGIIIDDLHWLDSASSGLLHYVSRATAGSRIAIACAARDGELGDNPAALRFVRALRREERLLRFDLAPFDELATSELVAAAFERLDGPRIFRESGGNPLFALEVARSLATGGSGRDGEERTPRALDVLLEERLGRLGASSRDVVVWASALGRSFDPQLLGRVTGDNLALTVDALGDLEKHGVLVSPDGVSYSFTHELVRRAAYRTLSAPRRRLVHAAIAHALARAEPPDEAWGDVVHHATLADDAALTARACVAAGERCLRLHARVEARELAARGLRHAAKLGQSDGLAVRLDLLRVAAYAALGSGPYAFDFEAEARDAVQLARDLGRPEDEVSGLTVLSFFRHSIADDEGARANTLSAVEVAVTADPVASVATIAHSAFCLVLIERDLPQARALLADASAIAAAHRLAVTDLELAMGTLHHFDGDEAAARPRLERAATLARARGDAWRESVAVTRLGMLAIEHGTEEEALRCVEQLREVAKKFGDGAEAATAEALEAAARRRSLGDRRASVEAAVKALAAVDSKSMIAFVLTMAAEAELDAEGALDSARQWATAALRAAEPIGRPSAIALAHVALGRAALLTGAEEDARAHVAAASSVVADPAAMSSRARSALAALVQRFNAGTNGHALGRELRTEGRR